MKDKSGSIGLTKSQIIFEIKEKYNYYFELIRKYRLDTPHIHKEYCNGDSHRKCSAIWGHSCIVIDLICKLYWWFTGIQPLNPAAKKTREGSEPRNPQLQDITYQILQQRKENELEYGEYSWLMNIKDKCKKLLEVNEIDNGKDKCRIRIRE